MKRSRCLRLRSGSYREQEFACGDKHVPNVGWVTSIYARRDGRWENVLFEHYAVPPPKPAAAAKP